jgi:hypothetical protein
VSDLYVPSKVNHHAHHRMAGMTGTFNSTVQAEINGQSTAPIGGTATSSASSAMKTAYTTPAASTLGSKTSASASTSATATKTGAAGKVGVTGITCFVGAAASLLGAMLL